MKKKKKSTNVRSKPFKRWVLVLEYSRVVVPTATTRRRLIQEGREKRVEFNRAMTREEVKNTLLRSFPALRLQKPSFLKCNASKRLTEVENLNDFPNGYQLLEISSKESMYLVEDQIEKVSGYTWLYS